MRRITNLISAWALVLGSCSPELAAAHDPDHHEWDAWYSSVHMPDNPIASCCGPGDAYYMIEYRPSSEPGYAFEGWTEGKPGGEGPQYVYIPDRKVNWEVVNPTGVRGVVWVAAGEIDFGGLGGKPLVLCFVPGSGS